MNKIKFNTVIICMDLFYFPIMLYHNLIILFITTITVAKQHLNCQKLYNILAFIPKQITIVSAL